MTNHFYAIDPQGLAHTRSSQRRTYTHTVVFLRGPAKQAADLAQALAYAAKQAPETYAWYVGMTDGTEEAATKRRYPDLYAQAHYDAEKAKYTAKLAGRTVEQFTADEIERARTSHAKSVAAGYYNTFHNAGWCGRYDLAQKLAGQTAGNVFILEALIGKPAKKEVA